MGTREVAGEYHSNIGGDKISQKVVETIYHSLGGPMFSSIVKRDIGRDTHIVDDLGADSADVMELVTACGYYFEINIPNDDAHILGGPVGDVIDYVKEQLGKKK